MICVISAWHLKTHTVGMFLACYFFCCSSYYYLSLYFLCRVSVFVYLSVRCNAISHRQRHLLQWRIFI